MAVILTAGALNLLRNMEAIDWMTLYSGEICMDELNRVRRVVRRDIISLPTFLADIDKYRKQLRQIAIINGLNPYRTESPALDRELAVAIPPRSRQSITAKLTVSPAPGHSSGRLKWVNRPATSACNTYEADTDKVVTSKDKLQLVGVATAASHVASLRLTSTATKRPVKLKKQCIKLDGITLGIKRLNFVSPNKFR